MLPRLHARGILLSALLACFCFHSGKVPAQTNFSETAQQTNSSAATVHPPGLDNPVANPRAIVILGHARFTVLTSRMIRMEWAADGKFENHATFVFLNRNMPVPPFTHTVATSGAGQTLTLKTDKLTLTYTLAPGNEGKFTPST